MQNNDYTSYEPLAFTVTIDNLEFDEKTNFVVKSDFAALIHEWWHYIQDISTVTGQNGVYMWLRDMARISKNTCSKVNEEIHVPLPKDEYGEPMSKYRKLYMLFCGNKEEYSIENAEISANPDIKAFSLDIDGEVRTLPDCRLMINGKEYLFRLIALQELNCYYAQKIAESFVDEQPKVSADNLPEFPYKVGDLLFDYYDIECDDRVKFLISYLCLDSIQAPAVFLKAVESFKGQKLSFEAGEQKIVQQVESVANTCACPNDDIYKEWMKDYNNWMFDKGRQYLAKSIEWFVAKIRQCDAFRFYEGKSFFIKVFCGNIKSLNKLYLCFPIPIFKKDGALLGSSMYGNDKTIDFGNEHEQALILRYHKRLFDLLSVKDAKDMKDKAECDMFTHCPYRSKVNKDYDCKSAVWEVVQGETMAQCPYAIALHTIYYKLDELIPLRGLFLVRTSAMLKSGFGIAFGLASVVQDCGRLRE